MQAKIRLELDFENSSVGPPIVATDGPAAENM